MTWYEVMIVSIGLSLDVFAYAMYKGAMLSKIHVKRVCKMLAIFAVWQLATMLIGSMVSEIPLIENHYAKAEILYDILSAVLFFGIGLIMILKSAHGKEIIERREDTFFTKQLCAWAAITSIDSFLSGVSMGFLNTELHILLLHLVITTILAIVLGVWIGYRMGCHMRYNAMKLGGAILLIAGADVLIRYYG